MFDRPYDYISIGKSETNAKNPYKRMFYKFRAKHRTYLVILEFYSFNLVAIKYCDVKDKNSKNAFNRLFNDGDAFKVIGTCFYIMYHYWRKNRNVNFVFYASLREVEKDLLKKKTLPAPKIPEFIERYKRARYTIYRYGMVNLFSHEYFTPVTDKANCIYVLLNKTESKMELIIDPLKDYLLAHHEIIFDPE